MEKGETCSQKQQLRKFISSMCCRTQVSSAGAILKLQNVVEQLKLLAQTLLPSWYCREDPFAEHISPFSIIYGSVPPSCSFCIWAMANEKQTGLAL